MTNTNDDDDDSCQITLGVFFSCSQNCLSQSMRIYWDFITASNGPLYRNAEANLFCKLLKPAIISTICWQIHIKVEFNICLQVNVQFKRFSKLQCCPLFIIQSMGSKQASISGPSRNVSICLFTISIIVIKMHQKWTELILSQRCNAVFSLQQMLKTMKLQVIELIYAFQQCVDAHGRRLVHRRIQLRQHPLHLQ